MAAFWLLGEKRRTGDAPLIDITPMLDCEGEAIGYDAIQVIQDDAPFLVDSVMGDLAAAGVSVRAMFHPLIATGRDKIGRGVRRGAAMLGLAALAACSPTQRFHGYVPAEEVLSTISLGEAREAVIEKAGPPTTTGAVGEDLYYVRSVFNHYGFFAPEEVSREVVAISFSPAGAVSNLERFDLSDGRIVPLTRRVTEDSVENGAFLRQLAGAAGNFDPSALINDE